MFGLNVVVDEAIREPVGIRQNRVHRRRRINKKWKKRYGFTTIWKPMAYRMGRDLYVHPDVWRELQKHTANRPTGAKGAG